MYIFATQVPPGRHVYLLHFLWYIHSHTFDVQQSVRHHLSLNRLFERQPRPVTDPGFGSYWTVNLSAPPGTKRPRKRGRGSKVSGNPPEQKKRGRPRKKPDASNSSTAAIASAELDSISCSPLASAAQPQMHARRSAKGPQMEDDQDECEMSEVEYESEEDMVVPPHHHPSTSSLGVFGVCEDPSSVYTPECRTVYPDADEGLIDRLQIENAGLRRQSADAISVSMRISDQLAEAHAEAARTRAALRIAENMLEDEGRKRRDAERVAQEEAQLRKAAEETIQRLRSRWENANHAS